VAKSGPAGNTDPLSDIEGACASAIDVPKLNSPVSSQVFQLFFITIP
jgi:hypothetical protein